MCVVMHQVEFLRFALLGDKRRMHVNDLYKDVLDIAAGAIEFPISNRAWKCLPPALRLTSSFLYLTSSGRLARSSLYSRQVGVSGFWCHRLKLPASPRPICAVTRGIQTTTRHLCFPVPTKMLSHDSCVTITIHCNN